MTIPLTATEQHLGQLNELILDKRVADIRFPFLKVECIDRLQQLCRAKA
jgi:hypothetical protein